MAMNRPGKMRPVPASTSLTRIDVGVGLEHDVVEDAHGRHHEAELGRELAAQRLDLLRQAVVARLCR